MRYRLLLGWLIAVMVVIMIGVLLRDSLRAASHLLTNIPLPGVATVVLLGMLMMIATGWSFSLFLRASTRNLTERASVVAIFLTAQIVKYLPGRIWGFVYQLKRLSEQAHASLVLVASLNHLILTTLLSVLFLGVAFRVPGAWLLLALGTSLGLWWAQRGGIAAYLTRMTSLPSATHAHLPAQVVVGLVLSLGLEWLCYLTIWVGLFMVLELPVRSEWVLALASFYAGAWILGSLVSLIPGGIGVREGGFILMGVGLGVDETNLVALAILARLVFMLGEVLTGVVAAAFIHVRERAH